MEDRASSKVSAARLNEATTAEFIELLKRRDIQIQAYDGRLKISAPAGATDASLQAELKRRKADLLAVLTTIEAAGALVPLTAEQLRGRIPLTPAQQGIWLIDHFNPGDITYNIVEAFDIDQSIDLKIFQGAVDRLLERHRILRTSLHEEEGELFQSIAEAVISSVAFTDLSGFTEKESDGRCREAIHAEGRLPFNLEQAPLVRFHLFRMTEHRHVVMVNIHHIISDRISLYVIREELAVLGEAVFANKVAVLPAAEIQYAEYAVWMAKLMQSEGIAKQLSYWRKRLEGVPPFLDLPHSRSRPATRSADGATTPLVFSAEVGSALKAVGGAEGASPFMTYLALFSVLIARTLWALNAEGAADFCLGSPITHRRQVATERMIGLFVNMLVFRCTVEPEMNFRELLRQVRGTALEAYENSEVPFQRLVSAMKPDRRSQRSPIFQVMFGYETYLPPVGRELQMDVVTDTARYDLALHLAERAGDAVYGAIEFRTDLFTEADAATMAAELEAIAAAIANDPEQELSKLTIAIMPGDKDKTSEETPIAHQGRAAKALGKVSRFFSSRS